MNLRRFLKLLISLSAVGGAWCVWASEPQQNVSDQTVKELFEARDAAWRSFFREDPAAAIEQTISSNVIAIQENEEKWDNRAHLIAVAKGMQSQEDQVDPAGVSSHRSAGLRRYRDSLLHLHF